MDEIKVWNNTMKAALAIPFVKVDRKSFLEKELSRYCSKEKLAEAIEYSPTKVVGKDVISKIANGCIKYHLTIVCGTSAVAGIPGGLAMLGTIPADVAQFYAHVFALVQKLLYIYGYPDLQNEKGEIDDESANLLTLATGVMFGNQLAISATREALKGLAEQVVKRLPKMRLTKYAAYNLIKQVGKWIGINITRGSFARGLGKVIPLVGAPVSAGLTYFTFKPMATKLKKHLDEQYDLNEKL